MEQHGYYAGRTPEAMERAAAVMTDEELEARLATLDDRNLNDVYMDASRWQQDTYGAICDTYRACADMTPDGRRLDPLEAIDTLTSLRDRYTALQRVAEAASRVFTVRHYGDEDHGEKLANTLMREYREGRAGKPGQERETPEQERPAAARTASKGGAR